jgi:iron complex outermembrane receptor protein
MLTATSSRPGDHIPGIPNYRFRPGRVPRHRCVDGRWRHQCRRQPWLIGDPSNLNPKVPAYWLVNVHSTYQVTKNVEVFGLVRNLFNQRYYTSGSFFETGSFPYLNLTDPRTFLPGMPQAAYVGVRGKLP